MKSFIFCYTIGMMVYELTAGTILYLCNISPISSNHIMMFLKIFIPLVMIGNYIILRMIMYRTKTKKCEINEVLLMVFSVGAFLIGAVCYHIISILLGASLIETVEETFAFSCLCSAMTALPLFVIYEGKWVEFLHYFPDQLQVDRSLNDSVKAISLFTVIGAWLGAFPIPLDWDRDWQVWPITCCVGAMAGHLVGECYVILSCLGVIATNIDDWKNKIT